jgi:hypothetical protein
MGSRMRAIPFLTLFGRLSGTPTSVVPPLSGVKKVEMKTNYDNRKIITK